MKADGPCRDPGTAGRLKTACRRTMGVCAVLFLVLSVVQRHQYVFLHIPLQDEIYLTVNNQSAFWVFRIGRFGSSGGLDVGFRRPNPLLHQLRQKYCPFPTNWYFDWFFRIAPTSPIIVLSTPLYFPGLLCGGLWLVLRRGGSRKRQRDRTLKSLTSIDAEGA